MLLTKQLKPILARPRQHNTLKIQRQCHYLFNVFKLHHALLLEYHLLVRLVRRKVVTVRQILDAACESARNDGKPVSLV